MSNLDLMQVGGDGVDVNFDWFCVYVSLGVCLCVCVCVCMCVCVCVCVCVCLCVFSSVFICMCVFIRDLLELCCLSVSFMITITSVHNNSFHAILH